MHHLSTSPPPHSAALASPQPGPHLQLSPHLHPPSPEQHPSPPAQHFLAHAHEAHVQADPHDWQQHSQVARDSAPQSQAGLQPHLDVILFFWKE